MSLAWRTANLLMGVFFGLASYVQHNDEWPLFWMGVYAVPCAVCALVLLNCGLLSHHAAHKAMYVTLAFYLLFSLVLFYRACETAIATDQFNLLAFQQGKELLGVLIVQSWLLVCIYFLNARIPFDALMNRLAKAAILLCALSPLILWLYHGCFGQEREEGLTNWPKNTSREASI